LSPKKNLKLSSVRRSRDSGFSRGAFLAACGGENRPNYFKNSPPKRTSAALRPTLQFDYPGPNGNMIKHPPNGWRWARETMDEKFATGELRFSADGNRVVRRTYLVDQKGLPPSSLWANVEETEHTRGAKVTLKQVFGVKMFRTQPPR
jgi:adenine-specific DNA-methyltransferase